MTKLTVALATVLLLLVGAGFTEAQTVQGVVTGTIFDSTGAVLPAADVTLTNIGTNITETVKAGTDGGYRFSLVPPGTYKLDVKASGFTPKQITNLKVDPSQTVAVNVTLAVATATTTIDVETQASLVQTATSDLTETVTTNTIANTALLTRNVFDLAFLAPSVTQGMNLNPSSGGSRESGTSYLLNGTDDNDNFSEGGYNLQPALESVSEFTMLTNNFSAQYGRGGGAVVSTVQKSGTNRFHGVAYEFNRNTDFNASDFFQNRQGSPNPHYVRNQFGGEIDGPIIKNKTFFAFSFDRYMLRTGSETDAQVPTSAELASLKSKAGPLGQKILSTYNPTTSDVPCPNEAQTAPAAIGHVGCLHVPEPNPRNQNTYFGRVDHNFSDNDRLSFTGNFQWYNSFDPIGGGYVGSAGNIPATDLEHYWNMGLVHTHTFSPSLVNEFTVAHNRHFSDYFQGNNGQFTLPEIQIDGADYGLGYGFGPYHGSEVEAFTQDRWQIADGLSWTKGKHTFKVGFGYQYGIVYRNWDLGGSGYYEFANAFGPTGSQAINESGKPGVINANGSIGPFDDYTESNFVNDLPYFQEMAIDSKTGARASAYRHYIMSDANVYVQDDWKVTPRLTLNLGLRWDRYGAPTEANGILAQFTNLCGYDRTCVANARTGPASSMWKTNNRDFGPRFGFAYDVFGNGRTAIRGGYGIFYDRIFDNVWSNGAWNPPFYALLDWDASGSDSVYYSLPVSTGTSYVPNSIPGPGHRVSVRTMDVALKDTSIQNFYFGVEQQLFRNFLIRVNYQGNLGRHLPQLMNLNRYDGLRYNSNLSLTQPNALYSGFNYRANNVNSHYNALVTEVQKRYSNGLQLQFSFTWSKLIDQGSDLFTGSTTQGQYSQPYYFISNSHPELEVGPGAFDHTLGYKANVVWEIPVMRDQKGFLGKVIGGWQISGFYQAYSGHPIEVYNSRTRFVGNAKDANGIPENIGGDYNLDGVNNDRPVFVGGSAGSIYSGFSPADGIFKDNNKIGCGFPGALSTNIAACNKSNGVSTPNAFFINPPGTGIRYGALGRNVFRGPWFNGLDAALMKNFRLSENTKLQFRAEALNLMNHPNFDGIVSNLNSSQFGRAQILVGNAPARRLQLGLRFMF